MYMTEGVVRVCVSINSKIRGHYFIWQLVLQLRSELLTLIGPCIANVFSQYNQQDATFHNLFISVRRSTCFRRVFRPPSGVQNCTYSVRYLSDRYCYLLLAVQATDRIYDGVPISL